MSRFKPRESENNNSLSSSKKLKNNSKKSKWSRDISNYFGSHFVKYPNKTENLQTLGAQSCQKMATLIHSRASRILYFALCRSNKNGEMNWRQLRTTSTSDPKRDLKLGRLRWNRASPLTHEAFSPLICIAPQSASQNGLIWFGRVCITETFIEITDPVAYIQSWTSLWDFLSFDLRCIKVIRSKNIPIHKLEGRKFTS